MAVSFDFKKRLGSGYFGEVWLVVDTGLNCQVALKCIPKNKIINPANFFQEAQVLKAAEHPNIIRVNDTGELEDGRVYVSMEYLPKGSLEDEANGAAIPLSRAKRVMVDVLRALSHAHSRNVVHRDVKPGNILIGNADDAILSDFGLALPNLKSLDVKQLKEYQYMLHLAPEIKRVEDFTPLTDVYAAGVTIYRLVNGDSRLPGIPPAEAQSLARQGKFPPRDAYRDYVPQGLRQVINKAIEPNPKHRYQSAEEMRHALERQDIKVDWNESTSPTQISWSGIRSDNKHLSVIKSQQRDGHWQIDTRRGNAPQQLRRVGSLSFSDLRKQDADKRVRRILQSLTTGKIL